jgi:hypothetical protein
MWVAIAGSLITLAVSIEGTSSSERPRRTKLLLGLLALIGFAVAAYAAKTQSDDATWAKGIHKETQERLGQTTLLLRRANADLAAQGKEVVLTKTLVGDLTVLNNLSGGRKYYVRVATDVGPAKLEKYRLNILAQFNGSQASNHIRVRPFTTRRGAKRHELIFGSGLDIAAAEVFFRLAAAHRFAPPGQIPRIQPEP